MILEHAILPVAPGQEEAFEAAIARALPILARQPGCVSAQVQRCLEQPSAYLLLVEWEALADHEAFRASGVDYDRWRALLHPFYEPFPTVEHVVDIDGS